MEPCVNPFLTLDNVDVSGKKVFLRLDLNMPSDHKGKIIDATRLHASLKTLKTLKEKGAKTLIVTHRGRPKGSEKHLSTEGLIPLLKEALYSNVIFAKDITSAAEIMNREQKDAYVLLENIRFWKGEEENDSAFAENLASLADVYVNDAFAVSHRKHASVYGVAKRIGVRVAGYNLLTEVQYLKNVCENPSAFTLSLIGGSKVSTKIKLLKNLLTLSKVVIPGGGMANTFLVAAGVLEPGKSFYEEDFIEEVRALLNENRLKILLPIDAVVTDRLNHPPLTMTLDSINIHPKYTIVDIGPKTVQMIKDKASLATTILWNGPFGIFEEPPFDKGSNHIADILAEQTAKGTTTIAGGGDTLACLGEKKGKLSFVSTAGGAFLEYLEECTLPGIKVLYRNLY